MKKFNLKLIPFLLLPSVFQGCMPDSLTKFSKDQAKTPAPTVTTSTPTPIPAGSGTSTPAPAPDLTVLTTFELKNVTAKSTSYHLHKYGAGNSTAACEIPISSLADGETVLTDQSNDILCWLEADETQLYFNGSDFQVNIPAAVCDYIQVKPYYYWNARPINTQKTVKTVTCADPTIPACAAAGDVTVANTTCAGDYTAIGGPNCDEGYVTLNSYSVDATGITTMTTATTACGGERTKCYGGPGVDFGVSKDGHPIATDYLAYNGQSINYSVTAPGPLGKGYGSNKYISNFTNLFSTSTYTYDYTSIGSTTGIERFSNTSQTTSLTYSNIWDSTFDSNIGILTSSTAAVDAALDPLKRADSTLHQTGTTTWGTWNETHNVQPFYEFSCLNYAHEVKGRIRLQIREWNQKFKEPVASYTEVSESSPARLLKQSATSTDYETSGVGYWNDISNWDTPYAYGPSTGGIPATPNDITTYGFLFPYLGF